LEPAHDGEVPDFMTLTAAEGTTLAVSSSGRLALFDAAAAAPARRLVAQAAVHLPPSCLGLHPSVVRQDLVGGAVVRAVLRWGSAADPQAELHVVAAAQDEDDRPWCRVRGSAGCAHSMRHVFLLRRALAVPHPSPLTPHPSPLTPHPSPLTPPLALTATSQALSHGFHLEFRVAAAAASRAELAVHLEPSGHWFGGGHFIRQLWPLNGAALEVGPWYGFDNGPNGVNNLLGPHWMTSAGLLVSVDPDTPFLHIGMNAPLGGAGGDGWTPRKWGVGIQNAARELLPLSLDHRRVARAGSDGLLRVQARGSYAGAAVDHPMRDWPAADDGCDAEDPAPGCGMTAVRVALCAAPDAAQALKMALRTLSPPKIVPSLDILRAPIWTTWARYKTGVTQAKVLRYAQEIAGRGLARSVMEVDDRWQTAYGDLTFDAVKFPDPVGMVAALRAVGFSTTVWVHPFVEERSAAFREGAALGYFVGSDAPPQEGYAGGALGWLRRRVLGGGAPAVPPPPGPGGHQAAFFRWWNPEPVAALDVTNPAAVDWFVGRLKALQAATGIAGFKFDAGEPCFLPARPRTYAELATPADYTRLYVERVAGAFAGGVSEVRTGHQTQSTAVLCRMGDRFSTWDAANGLRSLIPTLLTSGLLGYPFCLPDMIGGNAYFGQSPDAELLVRWAQANALMPAMQFSIAPWDLGREAEGLVAGALALRARLEGVLLALAEEAAAELTPICRPLWMLAPADSHTWAIADQFALGQDVIVAPVVHRGARRRDVYLTEGRWRSLAAPAAVLEGGRWLRGLPAPLDCLPVFVRDGTPGVVL
jgi:hypothetical protein